MTWSRVALAAVAGVVVAPVEVSVLLLLTAFCASMSVVLIRHGLSPVGDHRG